MPAICTNPACLPLPPCCACSNFAPLELAEFQKLMNSVKRGDIVGVAGEQL